MADKKTTTADKKTTMAGLTPRDVELAVLGWRALKTADVDYEKLAQVAGFKSAVSARACFGPVKKKLQSSDVVTPAKGGAKRRAAAAAGEEDDGDDINPTPTKKPRGRPKKVVMPASKAADAPADGDADNESEGM